MQFCKSYEIIQKSKNKKMEKEKEKKEEKAGETKSAQLPKSAPAQHHPVPNRYRRQPLQPLTSRARLSDESIVSTRPSQSREPLPPSDPAPRVNPNP
jgi:hypothetical protein